MSNKKSHFSLLRRKRNSVYFYVYKGIESVMFILEIIIRRQTELVEWEKTMKFH